MDQNAIIAAIEKRNRFRKLFREYGSPYDHSQPFGPRNVGPYDWQVEFHNAGAEYPERLLIAANQVGKTRTGGAEVAIHATGEYPEWWQGRRFEDPIEAWCGAESADDIKQYIQPEFIGSMNDFGTGWIPGERILDKSFRQAGVPEVLESITVRHKSGGASVVAFKTYQQEARGWRGKKLDVVWADELIPQDIYSEAQTRLIARKGSMLVTFTPMEGPTDVVRHFLEAKAGSGIFYKNVTWDDAPHLDPKERARLAASYPEHERDARTKGVPMLGSGMIFPIADEDITVAPFTIPDHWARINGHDFGIDHPAAGAFCAWDKDGDTFYVYDVYKKPGETPVYHVPAMRKHGAWIPTAWPHDGFQKDKGSGDVLKDQYRKLGLLMLPEHAAYPDERGNHREPSLIEMYEWMRTHRFKVFSTCTQFFEEKRLYHRKDGQVVAKNDDILSAARYAFVMRRFARPKPAPVYLSAAPRAPILGGRAA